MRSDRWGRDDSATTRFRQPQTIAVVGAMPAVRPWQFLPRRRVENLRRSHPASSLLDAICKLFGFDITCNTIYNTIIFSGHDFRGCERFGPRLLMPVELLREIGVLQ
ncbi:MAG: hypothetical protein HUU23_17285 [Caldilineales bacterium]|nr:hypothetical protein [Caldilineales bacterium]